MINFADCIKMTQYVYGFANVSLGDIAKVERGKRITKSETKDSGKLSNIQRAEFSTLAKYGVKPIFVAFGADNARTIIDNMASDDWASFCEVNQWR